MNLFMTGKISIGYPENSIAGNQSRGLMMSYPKLIPVIKQVNILIKCSGEAMLF